MANDNNLIKNESLTPSERRENARRAGIASGVARRARKTMREHLLLLLETGDIQENLCLALIDSALEGDTKAFQIIRDTIGEKPIEKICTMSTNVNLAESYRQVQELLEEQKRNALEEQSKKYQLIESQESEA